MSEPPVRVTTDGVDAEPRRTGHRLFDLVMAISAISISVISLFVAIEHGHVERQLVAANSWPFLEADSSNGTSAGDPRVSIFLVNAGVGPAKLETLELFYDRRPLASPKDLLTRCCGLTRSTPDSAWIKLIGGDAGVIRPGQTVELLALPQTPENQAYWQRFNQALGHITYRGCYCSVLDECWVNDLQSLTPTPVKACPKPAVPYGGHDFRPKDPA